MIKVNRDDLVRVPQFPAYWCDLSNGDIYSSHRNRFVKVGLSKDKDGYKKICLTEGSRKKHTLAHRVLTAAKFGNCDVLEGMQVDHKVMVKDLNVERNLRIVTKDEQYTPEMRARMSAGLRGMRLSEEAVRDIRAGYIGLHWGEKSKYIEQMSKKYDRRFVIIKDVCIRRTYKKVV